MRALFRRLIPALAIVRLMAAQPDVLSKNASRVVDRMTLLNVFIGTFFKLTQLLYQYYHRRTE